MLQFPLSFEFNDHFLCTIAYHHASMRFRTFLLDSEHERSESGWMAEEDHKPRGKSLWDYMDVQKTKSPLYINFLYSPNQTKVQKDNIMNIQKQTTEFSTKYEHQSEIAFWEQYFLLTKMSH